MNKRDLIDAVYEKTDMTKAEIAEVVDATLDTIIRTVVDGEPVVLTVLGIIEPHIRAERIARNPQTGDAVVVPPRRVARLRVSSSLRALMNGERDLPEHSAGRKYHYDS